MEIDLINNLKCQIIKKFNSLKDQEKVNDLIDILEQLEQLEQLEKKIKKITN